MKRKIIVIADGHPTHKGRSVRQRLARHANECELHTLPGYAPGLNPNELLNQDLKSLTRSPPAARVCRRT